jgi:hypothetical protein
MIVIEKAENGYIVCYGSAHTKMVVTRIDDLFNWMLLHFENRCKSFGGDKYGTVEVHRAVGHYVVEEV